MTAFATYPSLRGKAALVSGGSAGIGAEIVRQLADQGARVAFLDIHPPADERAEALFLPCDVRDIAALTDAVEQVASRLGGIDILVNNAAKDDRIPFADLDVARWDEQMNVNVRHHVFATQAVGRTCVRAAAGRSSTWRRSACTSTCAISQGM